MPRRPKEKVMNYSVFIKNKFMSPPAPQIDGTTTKSSYH
jgi:hypothetical protein